MASPGKALPILVRQIHFMVPGAAGGVILVTRSTIYPWVPSRCVAVWFGRRDMVYRGIETLVAGQKFKLSHDRG